MEISDVHVKMIRNSSDRLKAVCTITFDGEFVVRDVKVVEGTNGMFVAMPSRKLSVHCKSCNQKNHLRSKYCNECGTKIDSKPLPSDNDGRTRLHRDIAHPITPAFRERVQEHVIKAYEIELESIKEAQEIEEVIEEVKEEVIEEPQVVAEETQEENEDDYESTTSKRKGSGFEEYDEIIASLKGSQQSRTEEKSKVIARDSEDESHEQDEPSEPTASRFQDEKENEPKEEAEPSAASQYDQSSESENQATAVNNDDDDCAFGEGIL